MRDGCGRIRHAHLALPLQRRAKTSPFRHKRRRKTRHFCCRHAVHARTVWSYRSDENRPDRIIAYSYSGSHCLVWNATCVNTFASSNLIQAELATGSVTVEVMKIAKYAELGRRFVFQPVAVETSGAIRKSTIQFVNDLGRRLAVRFQVQCESDFLFQRVSLAILRWNAFSTSQSVSVSV